MNGQFDAFQIISDTHNSSQPGPSAPPPDAAIEILPPSAMEAPPPYSTLPNTSMEYVASPNRNRLAGVKLCYVDFVPRLVKKKLFGKDQYEGFGHVVLRANNWLEEHHDVKLLSCETVTWFSNNEKHIFSDDTSFRKSSTVVNMRGLRFWYETTTIPSSSREGNVSVLKCQTFPMRPAETLTQLVAQINEHLSSSSCDGHIIGVETIKVGCTEGNLNVEETVWIEKLSGTRQFFFAVRVYTLLAPTTGHETIGYQDFVPSRTNRNKDNRGYELFADVMDRACRWVARQQGVSFTNLQTIPVKLKKYVSSEERCHYTVHGGKATNYVNVVRAYFIVKRGVQSPAVVPQPETRLSYRTFKPAPISSATSNASCQYEDMRTMVERVNRWIQLTEAKVFSVETVVVQASSQLGSEATYLSDRDAVTMPGRYLFHIRLFLNGDYHEPPGAAALVSPI